MVNVRRVLYLSLALSACLAVLAAKAKPKVEPPKTALEQIFDSITSIFVEAENWPMPFFTIHIAFLDFILALDTCADYRNSMKDKDGHPVLQVFFSCLIGTFGGTTMTAILLGQPPGWLSSLGSPVAFAMGFWVIFCFPGNVPYRLMKSLWPVRFIICLINCISGGHGVTSWGADKALNATHLHPAGSGPYALLCGMLSGCGGGILANWLSLTGASKDWKVGTPPVLTKASATVKTAAFGSLIYYLIRNPHSFFPWQKDVIPHAQAKTVVFLLWVAVLVLQQIGISDPLEPIFKIWRRLFLTPDVVGVDASPAVASVASVEAKKKD